MRTVAVIPARFGSERLPGKVLREVAGVPLIQYVYRAVKGTRGIERIIVATDDERVKRMVESFGGEAVMTSPDHASGSDRCAEVASSLDCDAILNVQGDEPLVRGDLLDALIMALSGDGAAHAATPFVPMENAAEVEDPNVVKSVSGLGGYALYFSRAPIPYLREKAVVHRKHIGVYCYRTDALLKFASLPPSPLERAEKLEQLRMLENGFNIRMVEWSGQFIGIDTEEDLERFRKLVESGEIRIPNKQ